MGADYFLPRTLTALPTVGGGLRCYRSRSSSSWNRGIVARHQATTSQQRKVKIYMTCVFCITLDVTIFQCDYHQGPFWMCHDCNKMAPLTNHSNFIDFYFWTNAKQLQKMSCQLDPLLLAKAHGAWSMMRLSLLSYNQKAVASKSIDLNPPGFTKNPTGFSPATVGSPARQCRPAGSGSSHLGWSHRAW